MAIVLVYSEDPVVRDQVKLAIGRSPAAGVDNVTFLMTTTADEVVRAADEGVADLLVLDGEAWPTGGLGISRQLKNSITGCPPIVVLVGRADDKFLGTWSQADAVLPLPIDQWELSRAVVALLTSDVRTGVPVPEHRGNA